jgi:hypothetical protein
MLYAIFLGLLLWVSSH